jgi:hypothetical protein
MFHASRRNKAKGRNASSKFNTPSPSRKKSMFVSPRNYPKKASPPASSVLYKDHSKKFSMVHDAKSFLDTMYTFLCADCPVCEALINDDYVVPEPPRTTADPDAKKDHTRHFGKYKVENDVRKIISSIFAACCESYQTSIVTKFGDAKWKLMKSVPELMSFVKFLKELKVKEKGGKQSVIAKARKAISSIQQFDHEDGNSYVARGQRLLDTEKALTTSHTSTAMMIEYLKDGLKPTYNSLIERWQLDEITGDDESTMPKSLNEFALVLTNYEQRSRKFTSQKQGPNNFVTEQRQPKSRKDRGCVTCAIAGRDSNHDHKVCKRAIKWRERNNKKDKQLLTTIKGKRKAEDSEVEQTDKRSSKKRKVKFQEPSTDEDDDDSDA